jgi:hypothetical protein
MPPEEGGSNLIHYFNQERRKDNIGTIGIKECME